MSMLQAILKYLLPHKVGDAARITPPLVEKPYPPFHWLVREWSMFEIGEMVNAGVENADLLESVGFLSKVPLPEPSEWEQFKSIYREGDRLFTFCSPGSYWAGHAGRAGWALVRDGICIMNVATKFN